MKSISRYIGIFIILATWQCALGQIAKIKPDELKCEYKNNPLGIDTPHPRMTWTLTSEHYNQTQSAYQILVAQTKQALTEEQDVLWDSGKVVSNQNIQIPYNGEELQSRMICFWKVRVWDQDGNPSAWSKMASWEMGLMKSTDWQAIWINDGKTNPEKDEDINKPSIPI